MRAGGRPGVIRLLLRSVFGKAVHDHWPALAGWAAGVAAFVALYVSLYPGYRTPAMEQALESLPEGMLDAVGMTALTTPEGYLQGTVFGLMAPLLFLAFAAGRAGRALPGAEEDGTLELLLSYPVTRTRLLLERFAAVSAELVALGLVVFLLIVVLAPAVELDAVALGGLAAAVAGLVLLGVWFATLAMAAGAVTGRRRVVLAVTAAAAVLGLLANTVTPGTGALAWSRYLSPFHYATGNDPLVNGVSVGNLAVLAVTGAALLALAVWSFQRRDVRV